MRSSQTSEVQGLQQQRAQEQEASVKMVGDLRASLHQQRLKDQERTYKLEAELQALRAQQNQRMQTPSDSGTLMSSMQQQLQKIQEDLAAEKRHRNALSQELRDYKAAWEEPQYENERSPMPEAGIGVKMESEVPHSVFGNFDFSASAASIKY